MNRKHLLGIVIIVTMVFSLIPLLNTQIIARAIQVNGAVTGHVYFQASGIGIPGALIQVVGSPGPVSALTDANGFYNITIAPGTYTFQTSCYQFKTVNQTDVRVSSGVTTQQNFYLAQPLSVAVVGDYNDMITTLLTQEGYMVTQYDVFEAIMPDISKYQTIIVNWPGYWENASQAVFNSFVSATDAAGVGVVWLDSGNVTQSGGDCLCTYLLSPDLGWYREYGSAYWANYTYYKVYPTTDSNLLPGYTVGEKVIHDQTSYYKMYAYYYDPHNSPDGYYAGVGTIKSVATVGYYYHGDHDIQSSNYYRGILKITRASGSKWVVLPMHACTYYMNTSNWTSNTTTLFLNSLAWTARTVVPHPIFCLSNLTVTPTVDLWSANRTVSVGIKDVWIGGTTTVEMDVDGAFAAQTNVTLTSGQSTHITWTTSGFNVGTHTVTVGNLTTTFTVRAPVVTVQAYQYNSNKPLAGAAVYGYYRNYTGPGWQTQWSYTYGGYGHAQFAQPVMDLTGDGTNEVIVGGYETTVIPGYAHILKYNQTTGNYNTLYTWNSGGGSPSGACPLPLGNGTTLLIMSWSYGSNPGVYAYRWNGKNLTQVDYYNASFVFDVYSADLLKNGTTEVVVSNAPTGGTPYTVFLLGWNKATQKLQFLSGWEEINQAEAAMSWVGDIYGNGKNEIVSPDIDGVWALSWTGAATLSATKIYGNPFTLGYPFSVSIGYIRGDSTPEIGLGNIYVDPVGAEACLLKYNTTTHVFNKVWDGLWPSEYNIIEGVAIGDAYNNGKNEFLAAGGNVHIIGWTGKGYAEIGEITQTQGLISGCNIGDMDNSGKNEVKCCDILGYGPGDEWIFKYSATPTPSRTWTLAETGITNTNGTLTFNSPSSIADMYLSVYMDPSAGILCKPVKPSYQYLLTAYSYIANDTSVTFSPTSKTVAQVIAKPDAPGLATVPHQGIVWVQKQASTGPLQGTWLPALWPYTCNYTIPTDIIITPEPYIFRHMLNEINQVGSWWYYFMAPDQTTTLTAGQTYSHTFAGPIVGSVKHTQTGTSVTIYWSANDTEGHEITGIALGNLTYTPMPLVPSLLNNVITLVGQTTNEYPLISLYSKPSTLITSEYITWSQKPATATVPTGVTVYYAELEFVSGPYGNPLTKMYVTTIVEVHK